MIRTTLTIAVAALTLTVPAYAGTGGYAAPSAPPLSAGTDGAFTARLSPHRVVTVERQCPRGGYFTESQAYRSNGAGMRQRWNVDRTLTYWNAPTGRVTFDGVTFRNRTRATVIVKGWCS